MVAPLSRLSQLERTILLYRQALLAADDAALRALQESYQPARAALLDLIEETVTLVTADGTITTSEAMQLDRAQELLKLVQQEVTRLANVAGQTIPATQEAVVQQALQRAQALAIAQAPTIADAARIAVDWTALNSGAVADLTGSLGDGSPLSEWLQEFVPDSVQIVRDTLLDGVARGINPEALGQALAQATDLPLKRAMTLSRTETLRAYRSASIQSYQENDDILAGWTWLAAHDGKACTACLAKSGQDFPLTVSFMPSHPRCRCSPAPKLKDDSLLPHIETGEEWFNKQPEKFRRESFPVGLRGDYDAGRVTLGDMAHLHTNDVWGNSYQVSTISQARANAKARLARGAKPAALPKPADVSFKTAGTLPDAERYAQSLGVSNVRYTAEGLERYREQYAELGIEFDPEKIALNAANATNEALTILKNRDIPIPKKVEAFLDSSAAGNIAYYQPGEQSIIANTGATFWDNSSLQLRLFRENKYQVSENETDVMIHEIGHFLYDQKDTRAYFDNARNLLTAEEDAIARGVSRYAATNQTEFVAEVFVQLIRGRPVSDEALALYRKFGGYEP